MGPDGLRRRRLRRHLPQLHRQDHEAHQAACPPMGVVAERTVIVDTWNSLDRVGQTLLLKNIKIYQLLVIHELGPLCHLLLSPHASDVLNTNYEETLVIERWMEHHLTKGMPAYEHRRQNRNYTTTYRMWGEKFETLPFHELRTEEAGHHWTPTAQEVHEMWEARLEDPTAPWYVSPAPERFPPLKTETPREPCRTK